MWRWAEQQGSKQFSRSLSEFHLIEDGGGGDE